MIIEKKMADTVVTRSGRIVKKPQRYEPQEEVYDDFKNDEYDDSESDINSDTESEYDSDSESSDSEAGSLIDFIVEDDSECEEEGT